MTVGAFYWFVSLIGIIISIIGTIIIITVIIIFCKNSFPELALVHDCVCFPLVRLLGTANKHGLAPTTQDCGNILCKKPRRYCPGDIQTILSRRYPADIVQLALAEL